MCVRVYLFYFVYISLPSSYIHTIVCAHQFTSFLLLYHWYCYIFCSSFLGRLWYAVVLDIVFHPLCYMKFFSYSSHSIVFYLIRFLMDLYYVLYLLYCTLCVRLFCLLLSSLTLPDSQPHFLPQVLIFHDH